MRKADRETFLNTMEKIKGNILIVEGLKDEKALKSLGLKNIVRISGKPLIKVVEDVASKIQRSKIHEVIILTDFDSEGRKLAARLTYLLQKYKIHPNSRLRREFMKLGYGRIEDMNGIGSNQPLEALTGGDAYVKTSTDINKIHDKGPHKGKRRGRKARHNRSGVRSD